MTDLCELNPLTCKNNEKCIFNISSNTTYCLCGRCHYGIFCENDVWREKEFNTYYPRFIASIVQLSYTILNSALVFELFIRCARIRSTNCGIYLLVYSILSLLAYICLVVSAALKYYPNRFTNGSNQDEALLCFITGFNSDVLFYLCLWMSSLIAFERGLIVRFGNEMNATRWRSFFGTIALFAIAGSFITPMLVYKCDWDNVPGLKTFYRFSQGFFLLLGIAVYIGATILILVSFTYRIRSYGTENGSSIRTFLRLLKSHLFIFFPPFMYGICQIPFIIAISKKKDGQSYYQCGISLGEFIIKIKVNQLTNMPYGLAWLLFVYPSRVYMNEFYINTWSGQRLASIIIYCRSYIDRACNTVLRRTNPRRHVRFENN